MTAVPLLDPGPGSGPIAVEGPEPVIDRGAPSLPGPLPSVGSVPSALAAIARGEPVVVLDDAGRENEGDLIVAAERATPETIAFLVRHTSGLLCVAMTGESLDRLDIPLMVGTNTDGLGTAFTVSVDHVASTTTGISAGDRASTIRALVDPAARAADFARPGHVFPLRARAGGVLQRPGHTEAAVDLARLAGLAPAGVLAEIVNPDGRMARADDLALFAAEHRLVMITVDDLVTYRRRHERLVEHLSSASLPTDFGSFTIHAFGSLVDGREHVALVHGEPGAGEPVLARVHSECLTGDVFASARCGCGAALSSAMRRIADEGQGIVVYVRGHEPDSAVAAHILAELGVTSVRLLTDDPAAGWELAVCGVDVAERVPLDEKGNSHDGCRAAPDRLRSLPAGSRTLSDRGHGRGLDRRW